jgi:hypothetical protein
MLKFEIRAENLGRGEWRRVPDGWRCGHSWIRPLDNPVLESDLVDRGSDGSLFTVRERDCGGDTVRPLTVDLMRKWPGDHVTLEMRRDHLVVHAGSLGTAPLHVVSHGGVYAGSWNLADLRPWFDPVDLNGIAVVRALMRRPVYSSATTFVGIQRVTERATATITSSGVSVLHPEPAEHVLAARDLAEDVDAVAALDRVLEHVTRRLPIPSDAVAVELSGGADSANVLLSAATVHGEVGGTLRTVGIEVPGRTGRDQRERRRALAEHVGAIDTAVPGLDYLPFDPAVRKQAHDPVTAYYREAFDAMRARAASAKARVVYLGLGGDEVNALHPHERPDDLGRPKEHAPAPSWLGKRSVALLDDLEDGAAPVSAVPIPTLNAFALHNPTYLDAGIWPVAPLAHPLLGRFVEQLPMAHRQGKRLFRERLARAGLPRTVTYPSAPENFLDLMRLGMRSNGLAALEAMRNESLLADGGWIDHHGLKDAIDKYARTGRADPRLADLITLELGLRSLQ